MLGEIPTMKGVTIQDRDPVNDVLSFDLVEVLQAIGDDIDCSLWTCHGVECAGGESADVLHKACDDSQVLVRAVLLQLARGVTQVIDGEFIGRMPGEDEPRGLIRAVDSTAFDVGSTRDSVLDLARARFASVADRSESSGARC
jgi:hypothetical protein